MEITSFGIGKSPRGRGFTVEFCSWCVPYKGLAATRRSATRGRFVGSGPRFFSGLHCRVPDLTTALKLQSKAPEPPSTALNPKLTSTLLLLAYRHYLQGCRVYYRSQFPNTIAAEDTSPRGSNVVPFWYSIL